MRAFANDIPKQQNLIKQTFAIEALTQIVKATPVKSGLARNSWNVGVGTADSATPQVARGGFGKRYSLDGSYAIANGTAKIQQSIYGQPIYITNALPYIDRLNNGYSSQAPSNFVQLAITRARRNANRAVIKYRKTE